MPTAELRLQYPNHAFNSCKVVVHCTKTAPVHARGVQWIVAFPWIQEAVVTARKAVFFALLALIAACANTGIYDEPYALVEAAHGAPCGRNSQRSLMRWMGERPSAEGITRRR